MTSWTRERALVALIASTGLGIVVTHGLAAALRGVWAVPGSLAAGGLGWAVAGIAAVVGAAALGRRSGRAAGIAGLAAGGVAAVALAVAHRGFGAPSAALLAAGPLVGFGTSALARRLPTSLDGAAGRRPVAAGLWLVLALASLVQTGRLAAHMTDPEAPWFVTTTDPFWAKHQCFSAYVYAADLHRQGEPNVYDAAHYPGLNPAAKPYPTVENLAPYVEDPYQYPPHFLLLPTLALGLTNDFLVIRTVWFALQATLFLAVAAWLAVQVGGRAGTVAALLIPAVFVSPAALHNFQYGQFHLATLCLAVGAMLAFARNRSAAGGAMLAAAIGAKLFPAVLLIPLALQRKWRALAGTAVAGAALTVLALAVLGPAPFVAFADYHLPRLLGGEAFAFADAWPEVRDALVAGNVSPWALVTKLEILGVPGVGPALAKPANWLYSLLVLVVAVVAARRVRDRSGAAQVWLALLTLASLRSPGAWGDYVPVASLWLLTFLAAETAGRPGRALALGAAAALLFFLPGVLPTPVLPPVAVTMTLSTMTFLVLVTLSTWVVLGRRRPADVRT